MSVRTQHFDEPIVRIGILEARFPRICPICGAPAKKASRIIAAPKTGPVREFRGAQLSGPGTKSMIIYVCDEHYQSDDDRERGKCLCGITNGLLISLLFVDLIFTSGDINLGRPISPVFFLLLTLFSIAILLAAFVFRSTPLERHVKIIGFDPGFINVWLQLRNPEYREAFMRENPMHAELVNWIRMTS